MSKVLNPYTGRYIQVGGPTHKKLMRSQHGGGPIDMMARMGVEAGPNPTGLGDKYDMAKGNKNRNDILASLNKDNLKLFLEQVVDDRKKLMDLITNPRMARQFAIMKQKGIDSLQELGNLANFNDRIMTYLAAQGLSDSDKKWLESLYEQHGGGPIDMMARMGVEAGPNPTGLGDKYDMAKGNKNRNDILASLNKDNLKLFLEQVVDDRNKMLSMLSDPRMAKQIAIMKKMGKDLEEELTNLVHFETDIMAFLAMQDLNDNDNKWLKSLYKK